MCVCVWKKNFCLRIFVPEFLCLEKEFLFYCNWNFEKKSSLQYKMSASPVNVSESQGP